MPRQTPSPIDLPEEALEAPGVVWTTITIAIAALLLLAMNAVSLRDWVEDLTPGPVQAQAAAFAEQWVAITDAAGLGTPRAWFHDLWKKAEGAKFGT